MRNSVNLLWGWFSLCLWLSLNLWLLGLNEVLAPKFPRAWVVGVAKAVGAGEALAGYLRKHIESTQDKLNSYLCDPPFVHCPVERSLQYVGPVVGVVLGMVDAQVVPQLVHGHVLRLVHGDACILKGILKLGTSLVGAVDQLEGAIEPLPSETLQLSILLGKLQSFPKMTIL